MSLLGCAHQLQFRVVDASSGSPILHAKIQVRKIDSLTYFRSAHEYEVGSTDTNGMIVLHEVHSKDDLHFRAPGYHGAVAGIAGKGRVGITSPYPALKADRTYLHHKVVDADGVIVISLVPVVK